MITLKDLKLIATNHNMSFIKNGEHKWGKPLWVFINEDNEESCSFDLGSWKRLLKNDEIEGWL